MERRNPHCGVFWAGSTASDEYVGVWTSLSYRASEALGYCTLSHFGHNTWARVGVCITQPDENENLFSDQAALRGVKRGAQRVFPNARLPICGICIKLKRPAVDSYFVELCNSGGDSNLQYARSRHRMGHAQVLPRKLHGTDRSVGGGGEHACCPRDTSGGSGAEGGKLFAMIVPKSNMSEAIQGETMSVTLTRGYFTEAVEEAKVVGRARSSRTSWSALRRPGRSCA